MATYMFSVSGEQQAYELSDAAWRFFEASERDKLLADQVRELRTIEAVAELGQALGFGTTYEDILQYRKVAGIEHDAWQQAGELTDDELDLVAGGHGPVSSLGLGGNKCRNACSGHGVCTSHGCQCEPGYTGLACDIQLVGPI